MNLRVCPLADLHVKVKAKEEAEATKRMREMKVTECTSRQIVRDTR